jgi:Flp pilus assembly pilin Flp
MDQSRSRPALGRQGQASAEYAALVALVGVGLVVLLGLFGRATRQVWEQGAGKIADTPELVYSGGSGGGGGGGGGGTYSGSGGAPGVVRQAPAPPPNSPSREPDDSTTASEPSDTLGEQHASR